MNFSEEKQLTSDNNIEDALVIQAMTDGETMTLREGSIITNVIIQLAEQ